MSILIRKATVEDLPRIQDLSLELFKEEKPRDPLLNMEWSHNEDGRKSFLSRITAANRFCLVAEADARIVGYATGSILEVFPWRPVKRLEMENLIVAKDYRGQRIGEQLAQKVFDLGKSLGMERVMVIATAANNRAIAFYQRIGFVADCLQLEKVLDK